MIVVEAILLHEKQLYEYKLFNQWVGKIREEERKIVQKQILDEIRTKKGLN